MTKINKSNVITKRLYLISVQSHLGYDGEYKGGKTKCVNTIVGLT